MNPICFYHRADLDGHCSGAIVRANVPDVELYGIDYGDKFPWDKTKGRVVYMVDFSLQGPDMLMGYTGSADSVTDISAHPMDALAHVAEKLIWIDHHKSAIEDKGITTDIEGLRHTDKAACELCWDYFHHTDPPEVVLLLGRYDVWDRSDEEAWHAAILPFQYGMRDTYAVTDPKKNPAMWTPLLRYNSDKLVSEITGAGVRAIERTARTNEKYANAYAYPVEFEGLRGIACNKGMANSRLFDSRWDEKKFDVMITYVHVQGKFWTVSLYSTKEDVDVSVIAKKYGGGGHKGAAGFQRKELPFSVKTKEANDE